MEKIIVIKGLNIFNSIQLRPKAELAFRSGYWNCFKYTQEIEEFCKINNIDYSIKTYFNFD